MFKWDGTDISDIIAKCSIYEGKYGKYKYWMVQLGELYETVMIKNSKNTLSCLVDELKSVFELHKLGTHWCKHNGKIRILTKCFITNEGYVKEELTLNQLSKDQITPEIKQQAREIFAFRELLGVTCSYSSSIAIRNFKNVISFYEPGMLILDKKIIPFTVLDTFFNDISVDETIKRLCKITSIHDLSVILHTLRCKIQDVIERTDKRNIGYKDCIMNRITERLQTTLTN